MEKKENSKRRQKYDREFLISKIAMMRIKGKSTHTILEFLMEEVGMSRKIAYDILQAAQKYIMDQCNDDVKIAISEAIQKLEWLYENGNDKTKLDAIKEINKLMGLYAAEKVDITSGGDKITEIKLIQINKKDDLDGNS
jgi:protein-disulfide isomerase-like protein with CxxC motif